MSSKKQPPVSTSELARKTGLNRATVRERLEKEKVKPVKEKSKEKLYDQDAALNALQKDGSSGLKKAQTAKTTIEAQRAQVKLDKERGELVPIHEVRADVQAMVNEIRLHFTTRAAALAPQLRGLKVTQIETLLRRDADDFFTGLRAEHEGYLSELQAEDESGV